MFPGVGLTIVEGVEDFLLAGRCDLVAPAGEGDPADGDGRQPCEQLVHEDDGGDEVGGLCASVAVALTSRVFAAYFLIQALMAGILARRARQWWAVGGFAVIGVAMATIMIFGVSI